MARWLMMAMLLIAAPAWAAFPLTIVHTRHQSAEVLAPRLEPLLSPGGRVSGINNTLLIRTDAANLAELRRALEAIDLPPRRLRIRVRSSLDASAARRSLGVGGELGNDDVRVRLPDNSERRDTRIDIGRVTLGGSVSSRERRSGAEQFVDTLDGGRASLFMGESIPMAFRQVFIQPDGVRVVRGTTWRDVGNGLVAIPELHGQSVRVVLSPESSRMDAHGRAEVFRLETVVEGRVGEWLPVGGTEQTDDDRGVEIGRASERSGNSSARFWLRVELLD
jgi:hypothetical protein